MYYAVRTSDLLNLSTEKYHELFDSIRGWLQKNSDYNFTTIYVNSHKDKTKTISFYGVLVHAHAETLRELNTIMGESWRKNDSNSDHTLSS